MKSSPKASTEARVRKLLKLREKVEDGGSLTPAEEKFLSEHGSRWAATMEDVAERFGVHRQTVFNWQKRDPEEFTKGMDGYGPEAIEDSRRR